MANTSRTTPARKPAAKKSAVHFSLVQAAREREETEKRPDPFTVELDAEGNTVTLGDPEALGWQEGASLALSGNPFLVMQTLLSDEDYELFIQKDYPSPDVKLMIQAWRDHYGIVDPGNAPGWSSI